jgi:hypothetical protein
VIPIDLLNQYVPVLCVVLVAACAIAGTVRGRRR